MVNLEWICKYFVRITSDNVDPGGLINGQLGKDLWRLWSTFQVHHRPTLTLPDQQTMSEVILPKSSQILPKLTPRSNIVRGNPSKVFADPSHLQMTTSKFATSKFLLMSLRIISKLSVNWPPHPPGSTFSEVILPKSSWILSKLSVDQPPLLSSPPSLPTNDNLQVCNPQVPSKVFMDSFQVEFQLTPAPPRINIVNGNPSKVFMDHFQVECWSTPQDQHCQR